MELDSLKGAIVHGRRGLKTDGFYLYLDVCVHQPSLQLALVSTSEFPLHICEWNRTS